MRRDIEMDGGHTLRVGNEFIRPELDLFTVPKLSDPIAFTRDSIILPMSSLDNRGPMVFVIPSIEHEFTDLSQTRLTFVVKVERSNGERIEKAKSSGSSSNSNASSSGRRLAVLDLQSQRFLFLAIFLMH